MTATEKELAEAGLKILHKVLNSAELLVVLNCQGVQSANRPKIVHWHKLYSGASANVSRELIAQATQDGTTASLNRKVSSLTFRVIRPWDSGAGLLH